MVHLEQISTLQQTLHDIDTALTADDFYEGDREEVESSRDFFESRYASLLQMAGQSIKASQQFA